MKNVTITLEEDVARWVRVLAAKQNTSVSRLVGTMLKDKMAREDSYERAMKAFFDQEPYIDVPPEGLPRREELYDRPILR